MCVIYLHYGVWDYLLFSVIGCGSVASEGSMERMATFSVTFFFVRQLFLRKASPDVELFCKDQNFKPNRSFAVQSQPCSRFEKTTSDGFNFSSASMYIVP